VRKYAIRRVIDSLVTLFLIIVANFFLFRLIPGDPIRMMAKVQRLRPEAVARLQELYGLHLPMWQQFFLYVRNLFTFQFGLSIKYMVSAAPLIFEKLWNSILLLTISGLLALIIGTVLGLISGWHRGKAGDISMVSASLHKGPGHSS
jgi:peptide/nickel transport system permease protein